MIASPHNGAKIEFISPTQSQNVTVSVTGMVNHPGLYTLPVGSRVNDAILAAGGSQSDAKLDGINLAEVLEDSEQINVPSTKTEIPANTGITQGKININQATLAELDSLPGIGAEKAQAIIDFRTNNGNFASIEDLLSVPGFGPSIFESIKELIDVK